MDAERSQPRLGAYVLPGPATDPKAVLDQARTAESFGLDVWIGERFDSKDLPALASAVGQVTRSARTGAALTVPVVRHPAIDISAKGSGYYRRSLERRSDRLA